MDYLRIPNLSLIRCCSCYLLNEHSGDGDVVTDVFCLDGSDEQVLDLHSGSQHVHTCFITVDIEFQCGFSDTEATRLVGAHVRGLGNQSLFDRFERDDANIPDILGVNLQECALGLGLDRSVGSALRVNDVFQLIDAEAGDPIHVVSLVKGENGIYAQVQQDTGLHQIDARSVVGGGGGGDRGRVCGNRSTSGLIRNILLVSACLRTARISGVRGPSSGCCVVSPHLGKKLPVTRHVTRTGVNLVVLVSDGVADGIPLDLILCCEFGAGCAFVDAGDDCCVAGSNTRSEMLFFHDVCPFLSCISTASQIIFR